MFCKNCGKAIPENSVFCPECGIQSPLDAVTPEPAPVTPAPTKPKKSKKGLIITIIAIVLALAIGAVSWFFIFSKPYEKEVENCLEFYAAQSTDVEDFITVAYMGGQLANADGALEVHSECLKDVFEKEGVMYYGEGESMGWKSFVKEYFIQPIYDQFNYCYGEDWELEYEIKGSKKLSDSKIRKLEDNLENLIDYYEEILEDASISGKTENLLEDYIDNLDKDIKKAYEVEVEIEIDGKKKDFKETFDFKVAKVGKSWIILDGPTPFDLIIREES